VSDLRASELFASLHERLAGTEGVHELSELEQLRGDASEVERLHELMQRDQTANIARLEQLAKDADERAHEGSTAAYWVGFRDGLLRSINVVKGNG
jgi:hypothetical protein